MGSIRHNRQALTAVSMILIPCLVLAYFIFYENIRTRIDSEKKKNVELAKVTAQYMDTYVRSIKFSLKAFSNQEGLLNRQGDLRETLRSLKFRDDAESYFILDSEGIEIVAYPDLAVKIPKEFLDKSIQRGPVVELLNSWGDIPARAVIISPIENSHLKIIGFAGAVLSMEKVARDFANIKVSNNGYMIMTERGGQVLVHPNPKNFVKRIPPDKINNDPIFKASNQGVPGVIEIVAPYDGKKKIFAYAPVKETGWVVLLVEPEKDTHVLVTENLTRNIVVFILVLVTFFSLFQYLKMLIQKEAQQEVIRSEKLALVGQLAAGMAHEIRNPLTAVKGFLQMDIADEANLKRLKHQEIMMSEIERIEEIITETLLLAKPQKQKIVEFDLVALLQQIAPVLAAEATLRNIALEINLSIEPLVISGDPNHTKQAIINIVKNAIEATGEGGRVTIECYSQRKKGILRVIDQGHGIAQEDFEKIGTPFFTTKETGTGLGLTVTNRIVEGMGGQISISSRPGEGTEVEISFPLVENL